MNIRKASVVYYVHNYKTLECIEKVLRKHRVLFKSLPRDKVTGKDLAGKDIVIVAGGDGTFLRVAHRITDKTPVWSVSSDLSLNEGFFTRASKEDFEEKFVRLLEGRFKLTLLPRLEAKINGKKAPLLAINEIFVGSRYPYHTSRYILEVGGKREFQKSSGILIPTHAGNSGWAKSAAKKPLVIPRNGFGYVVREPYRGRLTNPKLVAGSIPPGSGGKIRIISNTHHGIVVFDSSDREVRFSDGSVLEVRLSKRPLHYIEF